LRWTAAAAGAMCADRAADAGRAHGAALLSSRPHEMSGLPPYPVPSAPCGLLTLRSFSARDLSAAGKVRFPVV